ncbi:MAG: hypothetical protein DSO01_08445, partial [Archaeoglobi archaeon]
FSTETGKFTLRTWQSDPFIQAVISGKPEEYKATEQLKQFVGVISGEQLRKSRKRDFQASGDRSGLRSSRNSAERIWHGF